MAVFEDLVPSAQRMKNSFVLHSLVLGESPI